MKEIKKFLVEQVANTQLKISNGKIEQATRNRLKNELTDILFSEFKALLESEEIIVERIKGGIGIGVNNEYGLIPLELTAIFKNLDEDIIEKGEEYSRQLQEKAKKEADKKKKADERKKESEPKVITQ